MKKDIYVIKNNINNKLYVGQSVNPSHRWEQYKSGVKKGNDKQLIYKAMIKYGIENFQMEILEKQVENYDEREKYWIKFLNCLTPNGYNVAEGGKGIGNGINSPSSSIKEKDILIKLIDDIITSELSLKELAKKYNISYGVINEINQGHTYFNPKLKYPLRNSIKYSSEKLKQITYSLKYELDKTLKDISLEYKIDLSFLNDINSGKAYFREYLQYPIRMGKMKKAEEDFPKIKELLINSEMSQKEIAKLFNRSLQTISNINQGHAGYDSNLTYPLRKGVKGTHTCISPDLLKTIEDDIKNTSLSMNKIAEKYELPSATICGINAGKIKKYYNSQNKYPLRKK